MSDYTHADAAKFRRYGDIANSVPFDWWLVSADGAGFCLVPTRGVHTAEQVEDAKNKIQRDRDVVGRIRVEWLEPFAQNSLPAGEQSSAVVNTTEG